MASRAHTLSNASECICLNGSQCHQRAATPQTAQPLCELCGILPCADRLEELCCALCGKHLRLAPGAPARAASTALQTGEHHFHGTTSSFFFADQGRRSKSWDAAPARAIAAAAGSQDTLTGCGTGAHAEQQHLHDSLRYFSAAEDSVGATGSPGRRRGWRRQRQIDSSPYRLPCSSGQRDFTDLTCTSAVTASYSSVLENIVPSVSLVTSVPAPRGESWAIGEGLSPSGIVKVSSPSAASMPFEASTHIAALRIASQQSRGRRQSGGTLPAARAASNSTASAATQLVEL